MRISTDTLRAALKTTAPAVQANPNMPALSGVLIAVVAGEATFSTTDYQSWIRSTIPAVEPSEEAWRALVSHRLLDSIAKAVRAKEVDLSVEGSALLVQAGRSAWHAPTILGEPPAQPAIPDQCATLDAAPFSNLIAKVAIAAGDDKTGGALAAVELEIDDSTVTARATDRYRMHAAHTTNDAGRAPARGRVKIYPVAKELSKIAPSLAGRLEIHAEPGSDLLGLSTPTTEVLVRTIAVKAFAPIATYLAEAAGKIKARSTVLGSELADAFRGAAAALDDDKRGVRVAANENELAVSADDEGGAGAAVYVDDHTHDGPGIVCVIAPHLLLPILTLAGEQEVAIDWTGPTGAVLISIAGIAGRFAVQPIRHEASRWTDTGEVSA